MNALNKKLGKNGGFTLIEMLIVVAIIAILVAISIPLINSALERARDATDQANERAAKAEAVLLWMGMAQNGTTEMKYESTKGYYYDAAEGSLKEVGGGVPTDVKYGKCTGTGHTTNKPLFMYPVNSKDNMASKDGAKHTDGYLFLPPNGISDDGVVTFLWTRIPS